jgi:hypothetical protein
MEELVTCSSILRRFSTSTPGYLSYGLTFVVNTDARLAASVARGTADIKAWYEGRITDSAGVQLWPAYVEIWRKERREQARLLRELLGNPCRPANVDPVWLRWSNGTVSRLASVIYEDRRFEDLPILADALEEAGCDNADILSHCRQPGEHVRGCWVVDLLLGKS